MQQYTWRRMISSTVAAVAGIFVVFKLTTQCLWSARPSTQVMCCKLISACEGYLTAYVSHLVVHPLAIFPRICILKSVCCAVLQDDGTQWSSIPWGNCSPQEVHKLRSDPALLFLAWSILLTLDFFGKVFLQNRKCTQSLYAFNRGHYLSV